MHRHCTHALSRNKPNSWCGDIRTATILFGEKVPLLERYRHLTDREVLRMAMTLVLAQEIVAIESGYRDWAALKAATREVVTRTSVEVSAPVLVGVVPILFVRDVETSAAFYKERLGARLHLRFVDQTNFADLAAREDDIVVRQPWGGLEFHVRAPDGNVISLVQFRRRAEESREGAE